MERHTRDSAESRPTAETDLGSVDRAPSYGDDWVHELIAMTRPGFEIDFPAREINEREVPFVYDDFR